MTTSAGNSGEKRLERELSASCIIQWPSIQQKEWAIKRMYCLHRGTLGVGHPVVTFPLTYNFSILLDFDVLNC